VDEIRDRAQAAAPAVSTSKANKVIYVTGYGRSGSTLLDILLGHGAGIVSVGELDWLHRDWSESVCSCGSTYEECPFWSPVGARIRDSVGALGPDELDRNLRRVESILSLPALLTRTLPPRWTKAFRAQVRAQLDAIAEVGSGDAVLDSSKSAREAAGRALALERLVGITVKRIHLVRDGRAVLWSARRGPNYRSGKSTSNEWPRFSFWRLRTIAGWVLANAIAALDAKMAPEGHALRVHYEDLVKHPHRELERIGSFIGRDLTPVRHRIERGESFPVGHKTGGNRLLDGGPVRLRADQEWEKRLSRGDHLLFWALAGAAAFGLGYRWRPR
jgi:hypothetical protein